MANSDSDNSDIDNDPVFVRVVKGNKRTSKASNSDSENSDIDSDNNGGVEKGNKRKRIVDSDDEDESRQDSTSDGNTSSDGNQGSDDHDDQTSDKGEKKKKDKSSKTKQKIDKPKVIISFDQLSACPSAVSSSWSLFYDVFLLQTFVFYEADDQNDDNDDEDVSDDDEMNNQVQDKALINLLNDKRKMQEVNNKMGKIIKLSAGSEESQRLLFQLFEEKNVIYRDAAFCKTLFRIFLDHSGNKLLIKLLETESHKGRHGKLTALDELKSIWYDTSYTKPCLTLFLPTSSNIIMNIYIMILLT